MRSVAAWLAEMIRTEAVWMSVAPIDMRAGTDTLLARIVVVFGEARPHHAYLFANQRGTRMKVVVHDGIGIWLASRRLDQVDSPGPKREPPCHSVAANLTRWSLACRGNAWAPTA